MTDLPSMIGRVRWFSNENGHGMADGEDGYTYFLHYTEFTERKNGFRILCYEGQSVKFVGNLGHPRGPRALSIEIIK